MAELGNFTINITCPDEGQIKSLGDTIGKMVEEKYKQMVEGDKVLELNTPPSDEIFEKFKLGKSVCCGMGVGIQQPFKVQGGQVFIGGAKVVDKTDKPFIVVDGQVYINQAFIKEGTIQFKEKQ